MTVMARVAAVVAILAGFTAPPAAAAEPVVIGSKTFTESYVLAEIMAQTLEARGIEVERRFGLGGTLICYEALLTGEIDVYPEYTGTISQAILKREDSPGLEELGVLLDEVELQLLEPLGFNNGYALVVSGTTAKERQLVRVSDLPRHPELRVAVSHEFRNRPQDGWPGLAAAYSLPHVPAGIEHGLAYQAISEGAIDVTDAYTTDGDLERYGLTVLEDDRQYFPSYLATPLARTDLAPQARRALEELGGRLDDEGMRALNAQAVVERREFDEIATAFLMAEGLGPALGAAAPRDTLWRQLARNTVTHLQLTILALVAAATVGILTGIAVHRSRSGSSVVLYSSGLLQTIPSIALLALMIPFLGVGFWPAVVALFLYSLLPIVRNTIIALVTIDPLYRRVAEAMGLARAEQFRHVLLPLALPHVLAGVKTAAVISIGTATLAAFIGAGGLGEPIVTGLALNDTRLILQGAIPAAVLALLTEFLFELLERRLIPAHMRSGRLPGEDSGRARRPAVPRPGSVTVISWVLIGLAIVGVLVVLGLVLAKGFQPGLGPFILVTVLASVLQLIIGAGMLQGGNWARLLLLWAMPISILIDFSSGAANTGTLVRIILYIVFAIYLTRPAAVDYFTQLKDAAGRTSSKGP